MVLSLEKVVMCAVNLFRYVRSLSSQQLGGDNVGDPNICDPKRHLASDGEDQAEGPGLIIPCGLIAASFFNDTYSVADENGPVTINVRVHPQERNTQSRNTPPKLLLT